MSVFRVVMGAVLVGLIGCTGEVSTQPTEFTCAHAGERTPVTFQAVVDTDWSPEQQEQILGELDFWRAQVGAWVTFEATIGDCGEDDPGCIAAVGDESPMLEAARELENPVLDAAAAHAGEPLRVVGYTGTESMVLDASFGRIGDLFRHEWGHRLGLRHPDGGVMTITVGSSEITPAVEKDLQCHGLR